MHAKFPGGTKKLRFEFSRMDWMLCLFPAKPSLTPQVSFAIAMPQCPLRNLVLQQVLCLSSRLQGLVLLSSQACLLDWLKKQNGQPPIIGNRSADPAAETRFHIKKEAFTRSCPRVASGEMYVNQITLARCFLRTSMANQSLWHKPMLASFMLM